jgi:hypothetical protein
MPQSYDFKANKQVEIIVLVSGQVIQLLEIAKFSLHYKFNTFQYKTKESISSCFQQYFTL